MNNNTVENVEDDGAEIQRADGRPCDAGGEATEGPYPNNGRASADVLRYESPDDDLWVKDAPVIETRADNVATTSTAVEGMLTLFF